MLLVRKMFPIYISNWIQRNWIQKLHFELLSIRRNKKNRKNSKALETIEYLPSIIHNMSSNSLLKESLQHPQPIKQQKRRNMNKKMHSMFFKLINKLLRAKRKLFHILNLNAVVYYRHHHLLLSSPFDLKTQWKVIKLIKL